MYQLLYGDIIHKGYNVLIDLDTLKVYKVEKGMDLSMDDVLNGRISDFPKISCISFDFTRCEDNLVRKKYMFCNKSSRLWDKNKKYFILERTGRRVYCNQKEIPFIFDITTVVYVEGKGGNLIFHVDAFCKDGDDDLWADRIPFEFRSDGVFIHSERGKGYYFFVKYLDSRQIFLDV